MVPAVFNWTISNTTAIALTQTLVGAGNLQLNGSLSNNVPGNLSIVFPGFARVVTLTSANNLGGVNFTISGTLDGQIVSQTIAGPNNNTVTTAQIFDAVTSITTSNAAAAVSAGIGATGRTGWFRHDYHSTSGLWSVQVVATATIAYSLNVTLADVYKTTTPTLFNPGVLNNQNATATAIGINPAVRFSTISVTASDAAGSLIATFLQQGLM